MGKINIKDVKCCIIIIFRSRRSFPDRTRISTRVQSYIWLIGYPLCGGSSVTDDVSSQSDQQLEQQYSIREAFEQIGGKWELIVIYKLQNGEKRFNDLKRSTDANARTLSRVLDDLQELGFVACRCERESPIATYYSLTEKGKSLESVFATLEQWNRNWCGR